MMNSEISKLFYNIARMLEIQGANPFRIRAYERAAQNISALSEDIEDLARQQRLHDIPGVGADLSERIQEYIRSGKIKFYDDLKKEIPEAVLLLLDIPSVGPKTARLFYDKFKIKSVAQLSRAVKSGRLKGVFGIKDKTIDNIVKGIEILRTSRQRLTLAQAEAIARSFLVPLKKIPGAKSVTAAGSLRRAKETVRDIDILVASSKPQIIMQAFTHLAQVRQVIAFGSTKASVRAKDGSQIDCRAVEAGSYGAALVYFTGSKAFNIKLRQLAIRKGLKINEYGVFRKDKFICGKSEAEVFAVLGLSYIEPELREDQGEIEAAGKNKLPVLLKLTDIKGDLHVHSTWSDGLNSIAEVAGAAQKQGYSYVAVTDHSQSLKVAGGLSPAELKKKKKEIDAVNRRMKNFRMLFGAEIEIDSEGKLDYKEESLKDFDIVVAAIHSGFKQSKEQLTRRLVRACENKYVHIIAHPTGKLWGVREPYELDFAEVLRSCRRTNTALEINAYPDRLDLDSFHCRMAKEAGVKLCVNTDTHNIENLPAMNFGVSIARRGWLERGDVINTLPLDQLLKAIRK